MMDTENIVTRLTRRYPNLERVKEAIFRGVDFYEGHPYAIRYFDLRNNLISTAGHLHKYQEELLGASYFSNESKVDLRWNHYLYFVISVLPSDKELLKAKAIVESDREYARKLVVTENDLDEMLVDRIFGDDQFKGLPLDPLSIWSGILDKNNLGFIIDETLQVPAIIRHIADGERKPVIRPPAIPELDAAEKVVADEFLQSVEIEAFRNYPIRKAFNFGAVNLILGVNGVGKTSLLEVIEYLFCGRTRRTESFSAQTSVAGVLASSKLVLQTNANTPPSNLRSRHLVWYGKSELRKLTLCDSFSKFNFLDTDAAVRLTVEKSRERIVDDLAQLLLGSGKNIR
jgi:DNA repair protein SbcC/Rad50